MHTQLIKNLQRAEQLHLTPAFAYDRISAVVQSDGISLEQQEAGAVKYANGNELFIVHHFQIIESASKEGRKVFNEMIELALRFNVKNLIFKNTDRMSRNYKDLVRIEHLIDNEDFNVHFYQTQFTINKSSSYNDRFLIGIQLAVAKHLSDKLRQDIKEANAYKARNGIAPGHSPLGYKYDNIAKVHRIDPKREAEVRYLFHEFDTGKYSLDAFTDHLNGKGIKPVKSDKWCKASLHRFLTNPFHHGEFIYNGTVWSGKHQAYYEKSRYLKRTERLGNKFAGEKMRDFEFRLNRLVRCQCGRLLIGERKKGKYTYYKHACLTEGKTVYIREEEVQARLDSAVQDTLFSPNFATNLKKMFRRMADEKKKTSRTDLEILIRKLREIEAKKSRLLDLYADEQMEHDVLKKKINELDAESRRLEGHRAALTKDDNKVIIEICRAIDSLRDRPAAYLAAAPEARADILRDMTDGITLTAAAIIKWKQPFSFLMQPAILDLKSAAAGVASPPAAASSQVAAAADSREQADSKEAARILYDKTPPPSGEKKANGVSGDDGSAKSSPLSTSMGLVGPISNGN